MTTGGGVHVWHNPVGLDGLNVRHEGRRADCYECIAREEAEQERVIGAAELQAQALTDVARQLGRIADALEDDPTKLARQAATIDPITNPYAQRCDSHGCTNPAMPGAGLCADHMGGDLRGEVVT